MTRPAAAERLRRLLAMVPWVMARGTVGLDEVAARFNMTKEQAIEDLELAACFGLPPYTPEQQIQILVDDDEVSTFPSEIFRRPMRFSAGEGFALLTAGRALLAVPGSDPEGPLARALDKLQAVLGDETAVEVAVETPPLLDVVNQAADANRTLRIEYLSAWRDELTARDVDPYVVYSRDGRWYVDAYDHSKAAVRHFRVDRIANAEATGTTFDPPASRHPPDTVFDPGPDATDVVLDLPKSARWVVETYPVQWEEKRGRLRVEAAVAGTAWLERLLLRVGAKAKVVKPKDLQHVGADAARRVLAVYER